MSSNINLSASVAKSLFLGNIIEENLFPFPSLNENEADTVKMMVESIDRFMQPRGEDYRTFDREGVQPEQYIQELRELGLFGLIIPEEFGGLGLSNTAYARVLQQSSRYDPSTSLTIGAHSSIGMKGLLLFGTEAQKAKYLPPLASGEMIAAFCLTEPTAGSDAASIRTRAEKQPDGTWVIDGEKLWITNGPMADFFTVFAKTDSESGKMSAFLVERGFGGVSHGPKEDKLGIRASATSTVSFNSVRVPAENLLAEEGKGFKVAMAILNNGRTGLGGGSVGAMKRCIELSTLQAIERKQFGRSISEFGLVKEKIAQMTIDCFVTESLVQMVGHYIDSGVEDYSVEAAISKVFASEALWRVANESLQIAGGNGYMKEFPYERVMRDSRINLIFEGTNEILRLYIGLSGFKDAGDALKNIRKGVTNFFTDPIKGFGVLSNYAATKFTRLTSLGGDKIEMIHPVLREDAEILEQSTVRLSRAVEAVLIRKGKEIVGEQLATKRIAEMVIDIFAGLCVLSRVTALVYQHGEEATVEERHIARIFLRQAKRRINFNMRRLISNEDVELLQLADHIVKEQRYPWDTL